MSDIIQLLPDSIANQIAAGEVIESPASVVKELMENAIDAGATQIDVHVVDAGRTLIQVIDNGKGMSPTDARMSFERHATSKIRRADDLFALTTMGFRGEALASIAAVSHVELRTRRPEDEVGTLLGIEGSQVVQQEVAAQAQPGSQFLIKNLFYNTPGRRKFMKRDSVEMKKISTQFQHIVLVYPNVSFSLYSNETKLFDLRAGSHMKRITDLYSASLKKKLLTIDLDTTLVKIQGYVGKTDSAVKNRKYDYIFVNGRYIRHPYFQSAVRHAYENLIPHGYHVNYFLFLEVDPANVDVNVHPNKTEVKFADDQAIWQFISASIKEAVGKHHFAPVIDFDTTDKPEIPTFTGQVTEEASFGNNEKIQYDSAYNPFETSGQQVSGGAMSSMPDFSEPLQGVGATTGLSYDNTGASLVESETIPSRMDSFSGSVETNQGDAPDYRPGDWSIDYDSVDIINPNPSGTTPIEHASIEHTPWSVPIEQIPEAQVEAQTIHSALGFEDKPNAIPENPEVIQGINRYIVVNGMDGLYMIDQRRAHIRILYERYMQQLDQKQGTSQGMLFPEVLELSQSDNMFFQQILSELRFIGFDLADLGGGSYSVNGVPVGVEPSQGVELLRQLLVTAMDRDGEVTNSLSHQIAHTMARATAIHYDQKLGKDEMQAIVGELFATSAPAITPNGKHVFVAFDAQRMKDLFG